MTLRRPMFALLLVPTLSGGGEFPLGIDVPCLTEAERTSIRAEVDASRATLVARGVLPSAATLAPQAVSFTWPLRLQSPYHDPGMHGVSNYVDQNLFPQGNLLDWNCGARTYDLANYNHSGTDIFTWPFGFRKMDLDEAEIVAAAAGVIVHKADGNFDRNCGFGAGSWNAVYVQHGDGSIAWYGHMKAGSPTKKPIGAAVAQGEYLGIVGSSGNSTGPHLHFEVYDALGALVDPYGGPCNSMNVTSWWAQQRPYDDSALNALRTGDALPQFPGCPQTETPNDRLAFAPGETIFFSAYYRDQMQGQVTEYRLYDAAGTLRSQWTGALSVPRYAASYWAWSLTAPTSGVAFGWWRFEATYLGTTTTHRFWLGSLTDVAGEGGRGVALSVRGAQPARGAVELEAELVVPGTLELDVIDVRGARVARLANAWYPAGRHVFRWAGDAPAGVYLARLRVAGRAAATRRLISLD